MYDSAQIQLQLQEYCQPLTRLQHVHVVCSLHAGILVGIKRGTAVSYSTAAQHLHTYSMHTKFTKLHATNQYYIANWLCMQELQYMKLCNQLFYYIVMLHAWWLIYHDAQKGSIAISNIYIAMNTATQLAIQLTQLRSYIIMYNE